MNDNELSTNQIYNSPLFELNECSICLDVLQHKVVITKCNHIYHFNCIKQWIKKNKYNTPLCPLCNQFFEIKSVKIVNVYDKDYVYDKDDVYEERMGTKYIFAQNTVDNEPNCDSFSMKYGCCNIL